MPSDTVLPHVTYRDVSEAIAWLARVFGFRENYHYGEPISGAQIYLGNAWIQLRLAGAGRTTPAQLGAGTQSLTVFIHDVDTHFEHAKAEGARIVEEPHETVYGEWQYAVEDVDGHHWLFSRHVRDVKPEEWGAVCCQSS